MTELRTTMSAMHGGGGKDLTPDVKRGLSIAEVESQRAAYGWNELPHIEVPLWWVFMTQFMGTMPYMLELSCILALIVEDWIDFGIIFAMVLCNGEKRKYTSCHTPTCDCLFIYPCALPVAQLIFFCNFHLIHGRIPWIPRGAQGEG